VETDHSEEGNKHPESGKENTSNHLPNTSTLKGDKKKNIVALTPFYPNVLLIQGRLESTPIFDDEPTMQGEEPP
jgi:hypothetical protein